MKQFVAAVCLSVLLVACGESQQVAANDSEIAALKARIDKLEKIQTKVAQRVGLGALVRPDAIEFGDGKRQGNEQATVAIVEFTDLHCPFCAKFHNDVWPELKAKYIDSGKVLMIGRELPLMKLHPNAGYAAVTLRCAAEQDQYTAAKDMLFKSSSNFDNAFIANLMTELALDVDKMNSCLKNTDVHNAVTASLNYGAELGFNGTPMFVVGKRQGDSVVDYQIVTGAGSVEEFSQLFDAMLAQ